MSGTHVYMFDDHADVYDSISAFVHSVLRAKKASVPLPLVILLPTQQLAKDFCVKLWKDASMLFPHVVWPWEPDLLEHVSCHNYLKSIFKLYLTHSLDADFFSEFEAFWYMNCSLEAMSSMSNQHINLAFVPCSIALQWAESDAPKHHQSVCYYQRNTNSSFYKIELDI